MVVLLLLPEELVLTLEGLVLGYCRSTRKTMMIKVG